MNKLTRIAIIIAVVFGLACAAFGLLSPQLWNSPDETAVAFFAKVLAQLGQLWRTEPFNLFQTDLVHPRSIVSLDGLLSPASFYGAIIVFGSLVKIFGASALSWGTPLITLVAGLGVFFSLRRMMGPKQALFAEVLFFANPAVWYYASRGLYPNLLFLDLAIIGLAVLYLRPWKHIIKDRGNERLGLMIDDGIGLFFLGMAFLVRPIEFIWLFPILAVLLWKGKKRLFWYRLVFAIFIVAAFLGVFFYTNDCLYGSPLATGYSVGATEPGIALAARGAASRLPAFISAPRAFILPFGFHPHLALVNLWNYLIAFAWWLPVLAAIGYLLTKDRDHRRCFSRAAAWTAAALGVYYGSGIFIDSSISQWTIGSSYVRYFLPATLLLVPLAAMGVERLSHKRRFVALAVLLAYVLLGAWTVYLRSPESLVPMRGELAHYAEVKAAVLKETQPKSVIVTERSDKIFFPDRKIILNLRDQGTLDGLSRFLDFGVYYYGITIDEKELPTINKELGARGLQLGRIKTFGNETLYGITKIQK